MRLGITTTMVVVVFVVGWLSIAACVPILNPDPKAGGQCSNGDQLGTLCKDGSCAPAGYRCAYDGHGVEIDETQWGPGDVGTTYAAKRKDAGQ